MTAFNEPVICPHLLDLEVASALRTLAPAGRIDSRSIEEIFAALAALQAKRYVHTPLLGRIWELRRNFTGFLAEAIGSILYTIDVKLRKGHRARVVVVGQT